MDRRQFLRTALLGKLTFSASLAHAHRTHQEYTLEILSEAWRSAATSGRKLVVIVVPEDYEDQHRVGQAWGELITHGKEVEFVALTLPVLVCASQQQLVRLLPQYTPQTPEPIMVVVDADQIPATWRAIAPPRQLAAGRGSGFGTFATDDEIDREALSYEEWTALENHLIDQRIKALGKTVRAALSPAPERIDEALEDGDLYRFQRQVIPGSRWGRSSGCGVSYETPDPRVESPQPIFSAMCGMGHVARRSSRFLSFLAE